MKSVGISPLFFQRFFIFSPERCDGNWKTILRILGSRALSHSLGPKRTLLAGPSHTVLSGYDA
jgi:hypothetical protein